MRNCEGVSVAAEYGYGVADLPVAAKRYSPLEHPSCRASSFCLNSAASSAAQLSACEATYGDALPFSLAIYQYFLGFV